MKIKRISYFKSPAEDEAWFRNWVQKLEALNQKKYAEIELETSLGKTQVWGINHESTDLPSLVIFPGARTTALIWDFDNNLQELEKGHRIYLVETNGLPNLSTGNSPDIKSLGYGEWAEEILDLLEIEETTVAGASFGGLIALKLGIVAPQKVQAAILLNSAGLQSFSLKWKNLSYNLLPIISPTEKNVSKFLNAVIFSSPNHQIKPEFFDLLVAYQCFAIQRYKDNTQKPYFMGKQLAEVGVDVYLIQGKEDILFPPSTSILHAKKYLKKVKNIEVFEQVGHGIETYQSAIAAIESIVKNIYSA